VGFKHRRKSCPRSGNTGLDDLEKAVVAEGKRGVVRGECAGGKKQALHFGGLDEKRVRHSERNKTLWVHMNGKKKTKAHRKHTKSRKGSKGGKRCRQSVKKKTGSGGGGEKLNKDGGGSTKPPFKEWYHPQGREWG